MVSNAGNRLQLQQCKMERRAWATCHGPWGMEAKHLYPSVLGSQDSGVIWKLGRLDLGLGQTDRREKEKRSVPSHRYLVICPAAAIAIAIAIATVAAIATARSRASAITSCLLSACFLLCCCWAYYTSSESPTHEHAHAHARPHTT